MTAYLDHAASTPLRPEALDAMLPFLTEHFGNPSGSHAFARRARQAVDEARDQVAAALGCRPGEVVFTAGGTEADNLAILGTVAAAGGVAAGATAVCPAAEHHAVLHAVEAVGGRVVPVDAAARVDLDALRSALEDRVAVVSVMLVNNEVGTVQPLDEVAAVVREAAPRAVLHTDAVQAFPWLDVTSAAAPAQLVSVSAHKFGGPKGVGALVVRDGVEIAPVLHGGGQERERRSGTHNVAGIVGMAAAMDATVRDRAADNLRIGRLRDRLADALVSTIPGCRETVPREARVPGNCHVLVEGIESEALLLLLDDAGVCASAGSSCASGAMEPSHVLTAMGIPKREALSSVRLSLGPASTDADVELAVKAFSAAVDQLRSA